MYAAQKEIAKRVGARHDYDVSVYAATETEPLAAAIENEKAQPEETPGIEEGDKANSKSPNHLSKRRLNPNWPLLLQSRKNWNMSRWK